MTPRASAALAKFALPDLLWGGSASATASFTASGVSLDP